MEDCFGRLFLEDYFWKILWKTEILCEQAEHATSREARRSSAGRATQNFF